MPNDIYYVFDDRKCKAEGLTKEQIINAIHEATGVTPTDVDEGFISTIVETNRSRSLHIWKGTQAEYNALETHDPATFYIIEDDSTIEDIQSDLSDLTGIVAINKLDIFNLETKVDKIDYEDAEWTSFTRIDKNGQSQSVGRYKIVGKFVFYCIYFEDLSLFTNNQFELPVAIEPSYIRMPFLDRNNNLGYAEFWHPSSALNSSVMSVASVSEEHPIAGVHYLHFNAIRKR